MHGACMYLSPTNTLHCTDCYPCLVSRAFYAIPILHITHPTIRRIFSFTIHTTYCKTLQNALGMKTVNEREIVYLGMHIHIIYRVLLLYHPQFFYSLLSGSCVVYINEVE